MTSIRGRSIDNINKKYTRTSGLSPTAMPSTGIIGVGSPISAIGAPLTRVSAVATGTPVSIMNAPVSVVGATQRAISPIVRTSALRSVSPTYTPSNIINYPSINTNAAQALISGPSMAHQTITRRSQVMIAPTVTSVIQPQQTIIRRSQVIAQPMSVIYQQQQPQQIIQ